MRAVKAPIHHQTWAQWLGCDINKIWRLGAGRYKRKSSCFRLLLYWNIQAMRGMSKALLFSHLQTLREDLLFVVFGVFGGLGRRFTAE